MLLEQQIARLLAHDDRRGRTEAATVGVAAYRVIDNFVRGILRQYKKDFLEGCSRIMPFDHYLHTPSNARPLH